MMEHASPSDSVERPTMSDIYVPAQTRTCWQTSISRFRSASPPMQRSTASDGMWITTRQQKRTSADDSAVINHQRRSSCRLPVCIMVLDELSACI